MSERTGAFCAHSFMLGLPYSSIQRLKDNFLKKSCFATFR